MENCVIVAYGRSPIAKATRGALSRVNPIDFGSEVLKGVVDKVPQLCLNDIEDLILGCAIPEGKMGLNPARNIVLRAGLPAKIPAQTVNRFCASGIQSIAMGASMIMSGIQEVTVAGGVESMTCPVLSENSEFLNPWLLKNTDAYISMGLTAENVAEKFNISRKRMEQMAVESNEKAANAVESGMFDGEIIPVSGFDKEGNALVFKRDECYRKGTNMATLATLKPCFKENGLVTAATSSQRSDGAAFAVLMSENKAKAHGIKPVARFVSYAVEGLDPAYMGLGPIGAVKKVLKKSKLKIEQIDVVELNEAFASQALASIDALNLPPSKVNPRGGALALGHPLGATGSILLCKAISYLENSGGRYALITMCIGGGMGAACIVEKLP